AALDAARAGDDADVAASDGQVTNSDDRGLFLDLVGGDLVRSEDGNHFLDPLDRLEGLTCPVALLADGGHNGQFRPDDDVTAQAQSLDVFDDLVDLALIGP